MTNEDYTLQPGTVLQEKYRIEATLGKGGFGITYRARHTGLQKAVAIKEFFMRGACERQAGTTHVTTTQSNREMADRFLRKFIKEAQLIASLSHPGIVRVSDIFETNGTAYYVMDYVEGENLNERVKRLGHLSEEEALTYIRQVGDALCYVHTKHMLHLDVKPANILLEQESGRAILIDFGVAKQYDTAGEQTSSTPAAVSNGYSPIEQYGQGTGVSAFTPATDVYALAATFYKLLTGITPPPSTELLVGETELAPYPAEVSQASREAIGKALQIRRLRPQSIKDFLDIISDTHQTQENITRNVNEKPSQAPQQPPTDDPNQVTQILLQKPEVGNILNYEGDLTDNMPNGYGTAYYSNGDIYEGYWKNGKRHGTGSYTWNNGKKYTGDWKNDQKDGQGTFYWPYGDTFTGEFKNDMINGTGTYIYSNGNKYVAEWADNVKIKIIQQDFK